MISIKSIFIFLVVSNLFALGVISYNYYTLRSTEAIAPRNAQAITTPAATQNAFVERPKFVLDTKYTFDDPKLATKALSQLDVFTPVPASYFSKKDETESVRYGQPFFGLQVPDNSSDYCSKNREAFVENPDIVFEQNHYMSDTAGKSLIRSKVISDIGRDIHPNIHANMPELQKKDSIYTMNRDISNYFTTSDMYLYRHIGQDFSCLAQASNHIPGHSALEKKDLLAASIVKYQKKHVSKPECFNHDSLFPQTFVLNDKAQCEEFFKFLDSPAYRIEKNEKGGVSFIRKTISETGDKNDVRAINDDEEEALRVLYKSGNSCGTIKKNQIVQTYIHNPLLINGKKFDFRMYMLAASTNPLIVYYHDGFLRLATENGADFKTATEVANAFLGTAPQGTVNYEVMTFEDFQAYLLKKGLIDNNNWLEEYLRPQLKKAMIHLMKMAGGSLLKRSSVYELYAVDFIMDTDLKLWFMEVDANPEFVGANDANEKFLVKMLKDHFAVVNGMTKSRMKRVVNYVNRNVENGSIIESKKKFEIKNLEAKQKEFAEISKNFWEAEYEPGKENGFKKIIDENYYGVQRYQWNLDKACVY